MSDIATGAAEYGDTNNTLLLKIATKFYNDLTDPPESINPPRFGDEDTALLLVICQSLELL
jgi:hypothetical protein